MTTIAYNDASFRAQFPAYANTTAYPVNVLQGYWDTATVYISDKNGGCYFGGMSLDQQTRALNLMTAHLVYISDLILAGNTPGVMTSAGVDKISVSIEPPPAKNQWQYWLQTSPYGSQLLALLQVAAAGGFFFGGVPELSAFRRVGGIVR